MKEQEEIMAKKIVTYVYTRTRNPKTENTARNNSGNKMLRMKSIKLPTYNSRK